MAIKVERYLTEEGRRLFLEYYAHCRREGMRPEEAAIEALDALLYDPGELLGEIDNVVPDSPF